MDAIQRMSETATLDEIGEAIVLFFGL
jgi:hypothetical protein